jgi:hypothetical protein
MHACSSQAFRVPAWHASSQCHHDPRLWDPAAQGQPPRPATPSHARHVAPPTQNNRWVTDSSPDLTCRRQLERRLFGCCCPAESASTWSQPRRLVSACGACKPGHAALGRAAIDSSVGRCGFVSVLHGGAARVWADELHCMSARSQLSGSGTQLECGCRAYL